MHVTVQQAGYRPIALRLQVPLDRLLQQVVPQQLTQVTVEPPGSNLQHHRLAHWQPLLH